MAGMGFRVQRFKDLRVYDLGVRGQRFGVEILDLRV
jgi:hypothetical protein